MVHHLRGQMLRPLGPDRHSLLLRHTAHGLDDGLERTPLAPRPRTAECGERHIDDARPEPCRLFGAETETGEGARPVRLAEDVGVAKQRADFSGIAGLAQVEDVESLPKPVSMTRPSRFGRCGALTTSTSAPYAASVRPHTGPAITRVQSSTRTPDSARGPAPAGSGGAP